jgi:Flp pilus assembly pilin Flp
MKIGGKRALRDRNLARDEVGGSAVETALIFSLAATMAVVVREGVSMPLLQQFADAAKVLERALN